MNILHKIINSAANRLSLGPSGKRDLIETVLRQLPQAGYWRLREQGFAPGGIIDIGAHKGDWTRMIRRVFPETPVLMIEARKEQEPLLRQVCTEVSNVEYALALLGSDVSDCVQFQIGGSASSIFAERSDTPQTTRVLRMEKLDDIAASFNSVRSPLFLKLDIQGGELECLKGGESTLLRSEVVQLEVALLNYNEGAPQAAETIAFMDAHGFAIFDIVGFVRPNRINLVQIDVIFVAKSSSLRPDFFRFRD